MSVPFFCPICRLPFCEVPGGLSCPLGHRFDRSQEGYYHLSPGKASTGDSKEMCRARHLFLTAGYYRPLSEGIAAVCRASAASAHAAPAIVDAGCGEGYYLRVLREFFPTSLLCGIDLAKESIRLAAKAEKRAENPIHYGVAGIFNMPLPDQSFDILLSVFAPVPDREAKRVLKKDGTMIVVHPGEKHLDGMKAILYDRPYDNEEKDFRFPDFRKIEDRRVRYHAGIKASDVPPLFTMTPYYWKTGREDAARLMTTGDLTTTLDFIISVYRAEQ